MAKVFFSTISGRGVKRTTETVKLEQGKRTQAVKRSDAIEIPSTRRIDSPKKAFRHLTTFFEENEEVSKKVDEYMAQIGESRKRAQKAQREINRLKKKTAALIDKLG